jgi:two-component system, chemotaxis family, chemotaxis protein CheY
VNILIADDDAISRMALRDCLAQQHRLKFFEFSGGEEAWAGLENGLAPALCLVDVRMPGFTGVELLRRMRSDLRFSTLPVMLITSSIHKETILEAGKLGLDGVVVKPVEGRATAARVLPPFHQFIGTLLDSPLKTRQRLQIPDDRYMQYLGSLLMRLDSLGGEGALPEDKAKESMLHDSLDSLRTSCLTLGAHHLARVMSLILNVFENPTDPAITKGLALPQGYGVESSPILRRPPHMAQAIRLATDLLKEYLEWLDIRAPTIKG